MNKRAPSCFLLFSLFCLSAPLALTPCISVSLWISSFLFHLSQSTPPPPPRAFSSFSFYSLCLPPRPYLSNRTLWPPPVRLYFSVGCGPRGAQRAVGSSSWGVTWYRPQRNSSVATECAHPTSQALVKCLLRCSWEPALSWLLGGIVSSK